MPSAARSVSVSAGQERNTISWQAPSDLGSPASVSYRIYRRVGTSGSFTRIRTQTQTSYTDTGLQSGTTYYYYVVAYNSTGAAPNSNTDSATPTAAVQNVAPSGAISVTISPRNGEIQLNWSGPANRGNPRATFTIFRRLVGGNFSEIASGILDFVYVDRNLTNGNIYDYFVRAINSVSSVSSNTVRGGAGVPTPPRDLRLRGSNIQWTAPFYVGEPASNLRYRVFVDNVRVANNLTQAQYSISSLSAGTRLVQVSAYNGFGESERSPVLRITI